MRLKLEQLRKSTPVKLKLEIVVSGCLGGVTVRKSDLRSSGRGFDSPSGRYQVSNNSRQVVHTHVPLSTSSIIWYRPRDGDALRLGE